VLSTFFKVDPTTVGLYILPFAIGNFMGPLILGRLFDTVGRKPMIAGTYIISGVLLIITGSIFKGGGFGAWTLTLAWSAIFFFASAGASAAYLTVSEVFPMETRAMSIALFYSVGTAAGGIAGPLLFGKLVEGGRTNVFWGWLLGSALMIGAGLVQAFMGVKAEQRSLEDIAKPVLAEEAEEVEEAAPAKEPEPRPARRGERYRLGPSRTGQTGMWSPTYAYSERPAEDSDIEREVDALVSAVAAEDGVSRRRLREMAESRYWGPGRFRRALRAAIEQGRIRSQGRDRFVVADRS
jgi:MFS family permease